MVGSAGARSACSTCSTGPQAVAVAVAAEAAQLRLTAPRSINLIATSSPLLRSRISSATPHAP